MQAYIQCVKSVHRQNISYTSNFIFITSSCFSRCDHYTCFSYCHYKQLMQLSSNLPTVLHNTSMQHEVNFMQTYQYSHFGQTVLSLTSSCPSWHGPILALAVVCLPIYPSVSVGCLDVDKTTTTDQSRWSTERCSAIVNYSKEAEFCVVLVQLHTVYWVT